MGYPRGTMYVVAKDEPVMSKNVVVYLGVPTPWKPDTREWWWVAPCDAADRPGADDYTRFADPADATAWVFKMQAWYEEWADMANKYFPKIYVREIG